MDRGLLGYQDLVKDCVADPEYAICRAVCWWCDYGAGVLVFNTGQLSPEQVVVIQQCILRITRPLITE